MIDHYSLNDEEQLFCHEFAGRLMENIAKRGAKPDFKFKAGEQEEQALNHVAAEIAYARMVEGTSLAWTGEHAAEHYNPNDVKQDVDCINPDGTTVDVKWTKHDSGWLRGKSYHKETPVDFIALVIGQFPDYQVIGVTTAKKLYKPGNLGRNPHMARDYAVPQEELSRIAKVISNHGRQSFRFYFNEVVSFYGCTPEEIEVMKDTARRDQQDAKVYFKHEYEWVHGIRQMDEQIRRLGEFDRRLKQIRAKWLGNNQPEITECVKDLLELLPPELRKGSTFQWGENLATGVAIGTRRSTS